MMLMLERIGMNFLECEIGQQRKLISFVLSNLGLDGKKLLYELKKPYDAIVECSKSLEWGDLLDTFRTKVIELKQSALIDSIKLIFQMYNLEIGSYAKTS